MKKNSISLVHSLIFLILVSFLTSCGDQATPIPEPAPPVVEIVIDTGTTDIFTNEKVDLSLNVETSGGKPEITWSANRGSFSSTDGFTTTYTAPPEPGATTVTVVVDSGSATTVKNIQFYVAEPPTELPAQTVDPGTETGPHMIADFDGCNSTNNLKGMMGTAYNNPDFMVETYPKEDGRGCVAKLEYDIQGWSAFWMKLQDTSFGNPYKYLTFDIRGDAVAEFPDQLKVEVKRDCDARFSNCQEVSITYITNISIKWQPISIDLNSLGLSSLDSIGELVFVVEASKSGTKGVFYLDNIKLSLEKE